jgi:alpha-L-arabinofuranosidase
MFSANQGDLYFENIIPTDRNDTTLAASCVQNSSLGDIILKIVNSGKVLKPVEIDLSGFGKIPADAKLEILTGDGDDENSFENPQNITPLISTIKIGKRFAYSAPPMSMTVIRIKTN